MKRIGAIAAIILATLTGVLFLWQFREVVIMFILSLALSAAVRPVVQRLIDRRIPHGIAVGITYLASILVIGLLIASAANSLFTELERAGNQFTASYDEIEQWWPQGDSIQQFIAQRLPPSEALYKAATGEQAGSLVSALLGLTLGAFDLIGRGALVIALSVYWTFDRVYFERLFLSLLPSERRSRARAVWRRTEGGVGAYIRSELIQSLIAGVVLALGLRALGMNYPVMLGLLGALASLVPLLGGLLAFVPIVLFGLAQSPLIAIMAGAYTIVVYLVLELVVEPRFFNRRRYSAVLTVLTMIVMVDGLGLVGLIFAPPLAAFIQIFLTEVWAVPTAMPAPEDAKLQLEALEARLAKLRKTVAMDPAAAPEVGSMMDRLEKLIAQARETVQQEKVRPPAPDAAAAMLPVERAAAATKSSTGKKHASLDP